MLINQMKMGKKLKRQGIPPTPTARDSSDPNGQLIK